MTETIEEMLDTDSQIDDESRAILDTKIQIASNGDFIYPQGQKLSREELIAAINYNRDNNYPKYKRLMNFYLSKDMSANYKRNGPDHHVVVAMAKYLVDTYNGYFAGLPPVLTLPDQNNDDKLQDWLNQTSFVDKLSELSKEVDIYGKSYIFVYQNEDAETCVTIVPPTKSFMIYDDSVEHAPIAYIRYSYDALKQTNFYVYYKDETQVYAKSQLIDTQPNVYGRVPAVQFVANNEKTGMLEPIQTLLQSLNDVMSQIANQIDYFSDSYLKIIGAKFPVDPKSGKIQIPDLRKNRVLMLNPVDGTGVTPDADFIKKPDGGEMQENYLDRIVKDIYEGALVPDPTDQNFNGNQSGVSMKYKYWAMQTKSAGKERKFTQALRNLFKIVFSTDKVLNRQQNAWRDMKFVFTRNVPTDLAGEISAAKDAEGLVSKQTQLSLLSFVKNPQAEIDQMNKEQRDQIKNVQLASGSLTDAEKDADDDEQ